MLSARRTEAAERDLRDIAFHIAFNDNRPQTADRVIDELIERADTLAKLSMSSQMGTACPEIGDGVRLFSHKRWVILFRAPEVPRVGGSLASHGRDAAFAIS